MRILLKGYAMVVSVAVALLTTAALTQSAVAADYLFFENDMVRGFPQDGMTGPLCVLNSQFKRQEQVVWRLRVFDPEREQQLGTDDLQSLVVELSDGSTYKTHFGNHPRENFTDQFWTVSWTVPADYPTGSLSYKVVAIDLEGKEHTWEPFKIGFSQLTIIPGEVEFVKP